MLTTKQRLRARESAYKARKAINPTLDRGSWLNGWNNPRFKLMKGATK